jgi:hypothetical protein
MLTTSPDIAEIATALAKAQAQMANAIREATNPAFRSKYADLAAVREATNGPLSEHGIACVQAPAVTEQGVSVETRLIHASGQWLACTVGAIPKDGTPQAIGSCITYLRRYGLLAMAGIAPDDDDGNAAQHGPAQAPRAPQRAQAAQARPSAPPTAPDASTAPVGATNGPDPAAFRALWFAKLSECGFADISDGERHDVQRAIFGKPSLSDLTDEERARFARKLSTTPPDRLAELVRPHCIPF